MHERKESKKAETELELILKGKLCPYCLCGTELVTGEVIYPERTEDDPRPYYLDKKFYICKMDRNHYVGTYADNVKSFGRLADTELRELKRQGHGIFDPLWKGKVHFKNSKEAYIWLSKKMKLPKKRTHFGMFTKEECRKAIEFCKELA
jgi:hypothetical protein